MPLTIEDGKIVIRENIERLSNPNTMRNNFKATVENQLKAKGLTGEALKRAVETEMSRVQIHHIIPDELIRNTELGRAAQKAGYNLDETSNLKGMPRKPGDRLNEFDAEHRGSHPNYTRLVREEIDRTAKRLKQDYETKNFENIPLNVIKKEMKRIENDFRRKIETNDKQLQIKDGRLSFSPNIRLMRGGNYEVRA